MAMMEGWQGKVALFLLGAGLTALVWVIWAGQKFESARRRGDVAALPAPLAPDWPDEAVPRAIRAVLDEQVKAWNQGDIEGFMAGYLRSPELTFSSGRKQERGWEETLERYRRNYQGRGKEMGKLTFSDVSIRPLRDDLALVCGRWKLAGSRPMPDGLFTLIIWRGPEGWRIIHDHTSHGEPEKKQEAEGQ
jgi:beta-aspartyl-peptidase (threonine type)